MSLMVAQGNNNSPSFVNGASQWAAPRAGTVVAAQHGLLNESNQPTPPKNVFDIMNERMIGMDGAVEKVKQKKYGALLQGV